jgi:hypothetical protein
MIRPWYRSLVFYLGVPGFLFLLWGWLAEPLHYRSVRITLGEYCLTLADEGRLARVDWEVYGSGRIMFPGFRFYDYVATASGWTMAQPEQRLFPPALRYEVEEYPYHLGTRTIPQLSLAYWFLLALYLPAWATLLLAWQRRKARALKASASPPP